MFYHIKPPWSLHFRLAKIVGWKLDKILLGNLNLLSIFIERVSALLCFDDDVKVQQCCSHFDSRKLFTN